ncbi:MAG: hypothetical protein ACU843_01695 [Gammaproteobacteria bacterium]
MSEHSPKPSYFFFWFEFNNKLWSGWTSYGSFPLRPPMLQSICFDPLGAWNRWIDQLLGCQLASAARPLGEAGLPSPVPDEEAADAILRAIQESAKSSLPCHTEFDTLIYPWYEAEYPAPVREHEPYSAIPKVA